MIFWTNRRCELDILFVVFGAHRPSPGPSKKVSKIGPAIGQAPGAHFSRFWADFALPWGPPWGLFSALWASFWGSKNLRKKRYKKSSVCRSPWVGFAECADPRGGFRRGQNSAERCRAEGAEQNRRGDQRIELVVQHAPATLRPSLRGRAD